MMAWHEHEDSDGMPVNPFVCNLNQIFGGSGHTTSSSTSGPWQGQTPYLEQGYGAANNLFQHYTPQYYPGQQVAPFTDAQNQGLNQIIGQASQPDQVANSAAMSNADITSGKYLNSNPYQDATAKSVLSQVIPQVQSQFIHGNSMNNPAAAYATAQGATSALAPIEYGQYNQGIQQMLQGQALAPQADQLRYFAPEQALSAGTAQQQQNQQNIGANQNEWNYYQQLPYQQLQNYLGAISGNPGGTGTATTPYYNNPVSTTMGSLGGLSSLMSMFGGSGGGAAAGAGAAGSGLLSSGGLASLFALF